MGVILDLLAERIGQSRKPPHAHAHRQVLPLNVRRTDVLGVGIASAAKRFNSLYLRWAVPARRMWYLAVHFDELSVINIGTEPRFDSFKISAMPVAGNLHSVR